MEKYIELLETWNGKSEDLCYELYLMLKKENKNDKIKIFRTICEKTVEIDSSETKDIKEYFKKDEVKKLEQLYGKYVDEVLKSVRKKVAYRKLGVDEFYRLLWSAVMDGEILTTDKEKVFALYWILADEAIPYSELGEAFVMENEEYRKVVEENRESLEKIKYILSIPFEQKTEISSLILEQILCKKEKKVQIVLLSVVLNLYAKKKVEEMKEMLQEIKK